MSYFLLLHHVLLQCCGAGYDVAATMMAMFGKLSITVAYSLVYVYAAEIFPTESRNIGLSTSSMSARLGSIVAPQMGEPLVSDV